VVEQQAGTFHDASRWVEHQVAGAEHGRVSRRAAPGQRAHPGDELGERERLAKVVVRAQREPVDPVLDRA
jgi:hypothetical protein